MRGRKIKKEVAINVVSAVLKAAALMWMIRLAGQIFSPVALGVFLLARQVGAALGNGFQLGASQTILRYVSMKGDRQAAKRRYVSFGVLGWIAIYLVVTLISLFFGESLALYVFKETASAGALFFWIVQLALAIALSFIGYATLVAERFMIRANLFDVMNATGFLLAILVFHSNGLLPVEVIRFQAVSVLILSLVSLLWYVGGVRGLFSLSAKLYGRMGRLFISYGAPRGVVAFLDVFLLLLGPWLLREDIREAGYFLVALTLLRMIQISVMPVAQVASMAAARYTGSRDDKTLKEGVGMMMTALLFASVIAVATLAPWVNHGLLLWLGDEKLAEGALFYAEALIWGAVPLALYQGMRGMVEMIWFKPYNLVTLVAAIVVQGAGYFILSMFMSNPDAAKYSLLASLVVAATLTIVWIGRKYAPSSKDLGLVQLLLFTVVAYAVNMVLASTVEESTVLSIAPMAMAGMAASVGAGYVILWRYNRPPALSRIYSFALGQSGGASTSGATP